MTRINPGNHPVQRATQAHFKTRASAYFPGESDEAEFFERRREHHVRIAMILDRTPAHPRAARPPARTAPWSRRRDRDQGCPAYTIVAGNPARTIKRRSLNRLPNGWRSLHGGTGSTKPSLRLARFPKAGCRGFSRKYQRPPAPGRPYPPQRSAISDRHIHRGGPDFAREDMLETSLQIADGEIAAVASNTGRGSLGIDASGLKVLPASSICMRVRSSGR